MKDEIYYFHQSPPELAKDIISNIPFDADDIVLEPFAGENAFYDAIPEEITKYRCEIEDDGGDFRDFNYQDIKPTMILSNPPFKLDDRNAFFDLVCYFSKIRSVKRIIFLCNDVCFGSLTPTRMRTINEAGMFLQKISTCSVKKWRGRYRVLYFGREYNDAFDYYLETY